MAFIVRYVKQSNLDLAERLTGKPVTEDQIERMKDSVRVDEEGGAIRLVEHLRSSGHIASYYLEEEL